MRTLPAIIAKLTKKGEDFAHLTWVGPDYSKADLLRDLRAVDKTVRGRVAKRRHSYWSDWR